MDPDGVTEEMVEDIDLGDEVDQDWTRRSQSSTLFGGRVEVLRRFVGRPKPIQGYYPTERGNQLLFGDNLTVETAMVSHQKMKVSRRDVVDLPVTYMRNRINFGYSTDQLLSAIEVY